jgi:hypothetical protein
MTTPPEPDPDDALDQIEADIQAARRQAEEHGTIPGKHERTFADPDGDDAAADGPPANAPG